VVRASGARRSFLPITGRSYLCTSPKRYAKFFSCLAREYESASVILSLQNPSYSIPCECGCRHGCHLDAWRVRLGTRFLPNQLRQCEHDDGCYPKPVQQFDCCEAGGRGNISKCFGSSFLAPDSNIYNSIPTQYGGTYKERIHALRLRCNIVVQIDNDVSD
jgi:hypothetical protein